MLCDVISCYGYDVNSAAAAQGAKDKDKDKDGSSVVGDSVNYHRNTQKYKLIYTDIKKTYKMYIVITFLT